MRDHTPSDTAALVARSIVLAADFSYGQVDLMAGSLADSPGMNASVSTVFVAKGPR
jgi:hypothetical protein